MKKLLIAFIVLLSACSNKKAQLVDLLRTKKIYLQAAQNQYDVYSDPYAHPGMSIDEKMRNIEIASRRLVDYQKTVDSIELELRKY